MKAKIKLGQDYNQVNCLHSQT